MTVLLVIAILVLLIVVHEIGHFVAAKLFRVKVLEFGIGYPPRAFLLGKLGGTEYSLNWIPFGGFVRLFGEEDERGPGAFGEAARWKQAVILVAGVAMNALAAWLLFAGAFTVGVMHPVDRVVPGAQLIVSDVVPGSPADVAGLAMGDRIIRVSDEVGREPPLTTGDVLDFVKARGGKDLSVTYVRDAATSTALVRPAHAVVAGEEGRPAIGVGLVLVTTASLPFGDALVEAYHQSIATFAAVAQGLWKLVRDAVFGSPNLRDVVGPVGLVGAVGEAARSGFGYVLSLAAFISVNLAVINLIPIPALDGGRLAIVGVEAIMRRSAPKLLVRLLNVLGMALVILLMVTVTWNDIARLLA